MNKYINYLKYFAFASVIGLVGCEKEEDFDLQDNNISVSEAEQNIRIEGEISSSYINTNLAITVVDESNEYISGAALKINGQSYQTSSKGRVLIENIGVNEDYLFITASKNGYEKVMKTITPSKNGLTIIELTLSPDIAEQKFSSSTGGEIQFGEVELDFPSNAIANANGDLYNGDVTINLVYHDPEAENFITSQPGTLIGLTTEDDLTALISEGMITVDLTDDSGNPLNITEGETVDIKMPASAEAPLEIPLWHLNETHGLWVEVGSAFKQGDYYYFEVSHFSSYNLDRKVDAIDEICFEVIDENGSTISNQRIDVKVDGETVKEVYTDSRGSFCLLRAPIGEYSLELITPCGELATSTAKLISTSSSHTYDFDLSNMSDTRLYDYSGELYFCNNELAKNKAFTIEFIDAGIRKYMFGYSDSDGKYSAQSVLCDVTPGVYKACVHILDGNVDRVNNFNIDLTTDQLEFDLTGCDFVLAVNDNTILPIPDGALSQAIHDNLNTSYADPITFGEAKTLTSLQGSSRQISSLEGMQYFTNLESIYLSSNQISDLAPLTELENLTLIKVASNEVSDLTPLSEMVQLTELDLNTNNLVDLSALEDLINITTLNLRANEIIDISSLENMTVLRHLWINDNNIIDISTVEGLTSLSTLHSGNNPITDISPVSNLSDLLTLSVSATDINSLTPIESLSNLGSLSLYSMNNITQQQIDDLQLILPGTIINY